KLGYTVVASTGRAEETGYLRSLGVGEILDRSVLTAPAKPLESERFGGAVDTVGGATLAGVLPRVTRGGSVAACGNAGGAKLETTVFPFILRGVNLLGIDSNFCPKPRRMEAWARLARDLPLELLDSMIQTVRLEDVPQLAQDILKGQVRGRVVVDLRA
ncbi:MAG: oxidoreductase, partial [Meiothermus sp.]